VIVISYGLFCLIDQYTTFVDELMTFNSHVKVRTPTIRVFLVRMLFKDTYQFLYYFNALYFCSVVLYEYMMMIVPMTCNKPNESLEAISWKPSVT